jgi:hypothetical protein
MLNVPADKITVHMLGVDEHPVAAAEVLDDPPGAAPAAWTILFVGTFEPRASSACWKLPEG